MSAFNGGEDDLQAIVEEAFPIVEEGTIHVAAVNVIFTNWELVPFQDTSQNEAIQIITFGIYGSDLGRRDTQCSDIDELSFRVQVLWGDFRGCGDFLVHFVTPQPDSLVSGPYLAFIVEISPVGIWDTEREVTLVHDDEKDERYVEYVRSEQH